MRLIGVPLPERQWLSRLPLRPFLLSVGPGPVVMGPFSCGCDSNELVYQRIERYGAADHLQHRVAPRDPRARPLPAEHAQESERRQVVAEAVRRLAGQRKDRKPKLSRHDAPRWAWCSY